jgi:hypothetical protein
LDLSSIKDFITASKWILAIIFILTGPIIGMVGQRWFPWVVAIMAGFITSLVLLLVFTVFGWMGSTAGFWCLLVLSIGLGVLGGWIMKKFIWLEVGLLGVLGGFFLSTFIYSFIVAATGWDSTAFYWTFAVIIMIICGILSWKFGKWVILLSTSGIGAYMFSRGWGYIFGGWPSEAAMMGQGAEFVEFGTAFYIYMSLFFILWIFFTVW